MNNTPSHPPISASRKIREYSRSKPRNISAGSVKITPEAIDCPALPVVWTMLFSRIDARPSARNTLIDSTEIGIDAATVSPARKPTYTVTAPNKMPNSDPSRTARKVNSGRVSFAGIKGLKSAGLSDTGRTSMIAKLHITCLQCFILEGEESNRPRIHRYSAKVAARMQK